MSDVKSSGSSSKQFEDEIDLGKLFSVLFDHKWLIVAVTSVSTTLGIIYALLATPIYQADALLQVETKQTGIPLLGDSADFFGAGSKAQTEIEIARSRMVLTQAIDQVNADISVTPQARSFKEQWFPSLFADSNRIPFAGWADAELTLWLDHLSVPAWLIGEPLELVVLGNQTFNLYYQEKLLVSGQVGEELRSSDGVHIRVKQLDAPVDSAFSIKKSSMAQTIRNVRGQLTITEKGKDTGILNFAYTGENRQAIVTLLDAIAKNYFLQNIQRRAEEAEKSLNFLQQQLPEIKEKLNIAENLLSEHRLQTKSVDLSLEAKGLLDQLIRVEARMNDLTFKENEMASLYTKEHPTYQTLTAQRKSLEIEYAKLQTEIQNMPENQQQVLRLTRDVELNQAIYSQLQNRDQELRILKAGTVGNVRIIDDAQVLPDRVKPKRSLIVLISGLLGGMLSVGLVLLKTMLNRGIQSPDELEQAGIAVYAALPLSDENIKQESIYQRLKRNNGKKLKRRILALSHPADLTVESLRSLRTSLFFSMLEANNKVVALSGPSPAIGKSFVATNLAVVLAQAGQKVLLIDADLRRGRLHQYFNLKSVDGLSEFLSGQCSQEEAISSTCIEGLDVIVRGQVPPNPSELLMPPRMENLFTALNEQYDMIIVDTPPILAVTDAAIIGRAAGTNLLITRFGENTVKEVEQSIDRFSKNDVQIKGVILNAIERNSGNAYNYYTYEYHSLKD